MSCAGKGYGTNPNSNAYLSSQFQSYTQSNNYTNDNNFSNNILTSINSRSSRNCRKYKAFMPSFTPSLYGLSSLTNVSGVYANINITGSNFLPNGTTSVKFGNYGYLPCTYYSSFNISFIVPLNANPGNYDVQVVNIYNGNFSPGINQSYTGNINLSNSITYTIS